MTRNYNTRHPSVTQREPVYHVAGGWVGGLVGVLCVLCVLCVDFELCLWLIVLCGKHSQVESVVEHICQMITQDPNACKNLLWTNRGKACLTCALSVRVQTVTPFVCAVLPSTARHDDQLTRQHKNTVNSKFVDGGERPVN